MTKVKTWNKDDFEDACDGKKLVVVDVFTTWCGPCKRIAPDIEKLQSKYKDYVKFFKLDAELSEEEEKFAEKWETHSFPTFLFFKNGKLWNTVRGANLEKIESIIENFCR